MYEHLVGNEKLFEETKRLVQEIAFSELRKKRSLKNGSDTSSYNINKSHPDIDVLRKNLRCLYNDLGMGFKLISQYLGNISYTRLRTLFRNLEIEMRTGTSCVTDGLKKLRSERAKKTSQWKDWTSNDKFKHHKNKRFISGWYFNQSKSKLVWLRSSWEYCYAKWLDTQKVEWDVEVRSYLLSDGRYYRPDFFIYENGALQKIIEIKSRWANGSLDRIDKFEQLRDEYSETPAALITGELFEITGCDAFDMIKEWKQIRIMEKPND